MQGRPCLIENNVIQLECRRTSSCTIRLHGGTISSWRVNDIEQLFVSKSTKYNWTSPINGGIYVVFPQFKYFDEFDNDFTKLLPWTLVRGPKLMDNGDMEVEIQLISDLYCISRFKHPFKINTVIRLMEFDLLVLNYIRNPSDDVLKFNFSIRAFLTVPVKHSFIGGLNNVKYLDVLKNTAGKVVGNFKTSLKMEILFRRKKGVPVEIARGHNFSHVLRIRNINLPNTLVWNEEAKNQPSEFCVTDNERNKLLCYEPTFIKPISLKPHSYLTTGLYFSLVKIYKKDKSNEKK